MNFIKILTTSESLYALLLLTIVENASQEEQIQNFSHTVTEVLSLICVFFAERKVLCLFLLF